MATSLAIAVLAMKKYRGQALAQSIAERTRCHVVPLTKPDPAVLNRCSRVLIESDMNLQGDLELIHTITLQNPEAVVVVLGSGESAEDIAKLAEAGACGYLPADADFEEMLAIVQYAAKGEFICPSRVNHKLFRQLAALAQNRELCVLQVAGLTTRERQVLSLLRDSLGKREIADRLCVSECTIKSHVHRVRQKLAGNGPFVEGQRSLHLQVHSSGSNPLMP
jgi:DNA-binding NarL/FixJ family response regulator